MIVGKVQQQVSADFLDSLSDLRSERVYTTGTILFDIGHKCEGIYLLKAGEVRLTLPPGRRTPTVELAGAGAVLGLSEVISGGAHRFRAQAAASTQVAFVQRSRLLGLLKDRPEFCMEVVRILSENLHALYYQVRDRDLGRCRIDHNQIVTPH
jgi:CRP-like cAMP-binding protein